MKSLPFYKVIALKKVLLSGAGTRIVHYKEHTPILPGVRLNDAVYIAAIAPRVSYGTISCLKASVPAMAVIPTEKVDRMPAADGTITERCAWAARTQNDVVYALKSGATPECFSSNNTVSAVLDPDNQMACTGSQGERELFFTGSMALRNSYQ